MRRAAVPLLVFSLAACQAAPPRAAAPSARPATAKPAVRATPTAGVATAPPARGATTRLSGTIRLDARYAVASGALAIGPGGALVSNNGGNALDPNGLLAPHAGLIGKIRFISDQGGGLIGNNGAGYRLAQLPSGLLPAAGLILGVYSLLDGGLLPVATDADGKPIFAVATGADGGFAVELPASSVGNVLVVASVPGTQDPGLAVDLVTKAAPAGDLQVADASTVVTDYLVQAILGRLVDTYAPDPCRPPGPPLANVDTLAFVLDTFTGALKAPAFQALPREAKLQVLRRFAGFVLAGLDLPAIQVATGRDAGKPALGVVEALLADAERAAAAALATNPGAFDDTDWARVARAERAGAPLPRIRKASELTQFMVREYLTTLDAKRLRFLELVLDDLGLDPARVQDLVEAGRVVFLAIGDELQREGMAAKGQAVLEAAIAEAAAQPAIAPPPCPTRSASAPLDVTVATLAGTGAAGGANGPGATATFDSPSRLALDPAGRWLYVSERGGDRIRAIDVQAADHPVRAVAGGFDDPGGLAFGPDGALYVADRKRHVVRRIQDPAGAAPVVSIVAGVDGQKGFADGAGDAARFDTPTDLAFGADGAIYVADTVNKRIRKVTPAGVVSTFVGDGSDGGWLDQPRGLLPRPGGGLLVADTRGDRLGRISPTGVIARLSGLESDVPRDGSWFQATYEGPQGLARTAIGDVLIADTDNHRIRLLTNDGRVITLAGGPDGYAEGPGAQARFSFPEGVAAGPAGTWYVADTHNHRIRLLTRP